MIQIALIDSGINLNDPLIDKKRIITSWKGDYHCYDDFLGHGTKCAYLIQEAIPESKIHILKVFDKSLNTSSRNIINAIGWCIANNIDIINLSLSINDLNYYYEFKHVCDEANKQKIIIIASADNMMRPCLPAYLDNVIGVGVAFDIHNDFEFYFLEHSIQLYANGNIPNHKENLPQHQTTSFATARVTGIISKLMHEGSINELDKLENILSVQAKPVDDRSKIKINLPFDFSKNTIPIQLNRNIDLYINKLGSVGILGSGFEIFLFKEFCHFLEFDIALFTEISFPNPINEISSENSVNKYILSEQALNSLKETDTLLLGRIPQNIYLSILARISPYKGNILLLSSGLDDNNLLISNQLIKSPIDSITEEIEAISPEHLLNNQKPILTILNLTNNPEIFNIELILRKELQKRGLSFGQLSSDSKAEIFGFDYSFASYYSLDEKLLPAYAKALIESVNNKNHSARLIISALNNKIIPVDSNSPFFFDQFSCKEISFLFGLQSDAFILVIDELVEMELIIRNIECIKGLLNTEVILIIYNGLIDIMKLSNTNETILPEHVSRIYEDKRNKIQQEIKETLDLAVYDINEEKQCSSIIDMILYQLL
jgi:hypothetical protein